MGLAHWSSLVYPCQSFSFTLFFRLIPWSIEAPCIHLSARVSKTWTGRRSVSSLPQETGRAPVASVNRANSLSQGFIGFLCKQRNISLFLSSVPLSFIHSFIYLRCFLLQVPLDPVGAGPQQIWKHFDRVQSAASTHPLTIYQGSTIYLTFLVLGFWAKNKEQVKASWS